MSNKRVFYAVYSVGIARDGENTFTSIHGLQNVGVSTQFNLEQVFEISNVEIYDNVENIPDVSVTLEKVLDGHPLIYHLATPDAVSSSLVGRSAGRAIVGMSVFPDTNDSASGEPLKQCTMSGMYVSSIGYRFQVNGPSTESVTIVGNNKVWSNSFTPDEVTPDDAPLASEGVNFRQHVVFGESGSKLPTEIPGIESSGYNLQSGENFGASVQSVNIQTNLGRENLFELGRRGPFFRYASFPVAVTTDIEVLAKDWDGITALADATSNLTNQTIVMKTSEGTVVDCGDRNKLLSSNIGGANAGGNGGNMTNTYQYQNFNRMTVTHPEDPAGL